MREAIDHLDLAVSDLDRSLRFYVELLRALGYVRTSEIEGERGERVVYVGRPGGYGSISVRQAQSDAHETPYDRSDPDGIKLEIVHRPDEQELTTRLHELERNVAALEGQLRGAT